MSREAKEENQDTTQIEINDSEEKDVNNPSIPEQDSQALGQANEEPEEEDELTPPTPKELKELRQQAAKAEEFYDRLQRQVAEADNLRKRLAKENRTPSATPTSPLLSNSCPLWTVSRWLWQPFGTPMTAQSTR